MRSILHEYDVFHEAHDMWTVSQQMSDLTRRIYKIEVNDDVNLHAELLATKNAIMTNVDNTRSSINTNVDDTRTTLVDKIDSTKEAVITKVNESETKVKNAITEQTTHFDEKVNKAVEDININIDEKSATITNNVNDNTNLKITGLYSALTTWFNGKNWFSKD